jgi:hypothetical protein
MGVKTVVVVISRNEFTRPVIEPEVTVNAVSLCVSVNDELLTGCQRKEKVLRLCDLIGGRHRPAGEGGTE